MTTREVGANGLIRVGGTDIQISTAISGWSVGLCPLDGSTTQAWFGNPLLGHLDPKTLSHPTCVTSKDQHVLPMS
jgi:hypothetical protein